MPREATGYPVMTRLERRKFCREEQVQRPILSSGSSSLCLPACLVSCRLPWTAWHTACLVNFRVLHLYLGVPRYRCSSPRFCKAIEFRAAGSSPVSTLCYVPEHDSHTCSILSSNQNPQTGLIGIQR